jgi:hypothetical protein
VRYHPRLLELAGHYHFAPKPCAPYRGNEKGKVERTIQYLRHGFFAARRFADVADLNRQLADWIAETAHRRPVPGDPERRLVDAALGEERSRLLPLPQHPFPCTLVRPVTSGKTPYVRFDGNDYSIPHAVVRKPLTLVADEHAVRLVDGATTIATHVRSYDHRQVVEDPAHVDALAAVKRAAHELRGRDRLRRLCAHAAGFLDALAQRGHPLLGEPRRLLDLVDRFGAAAVDAALADTLARGAVSATAVAHVLDQRLRARRTPPPLALPLPDDPRVRDLHVTPHALDTYDALTSAQETDHDDDDLSR